MGNFGMHSLCHVNFNRLIILKDIETSCIRRLQTGQIENILFLSCLETTSGANEPVRKKGLAFE